MPEPITVSLNTIEIEWDGVSYLYEWEDDDANR